jgi:hypothetical protein
MFSRYRLRPLVVGAFAMSGLLFVLPGTSRASGGSTAAQSLKTALRDATASGSVHESTIEVSGSRRETFSDDVAVDSGRQRITVSSGISAHVVLIGKTGYISGNQAALTEYFGFPHNVATMVGNRWVSVPSTSSAYANVASNATLPSAVSFVAPQGQLIELAATKMDGKSVIGIRGALPSSLKATGTMTIYITRSSHPLPVFETLTAKHQGTTVTSNSTFSAWGERVAVTRPAHSIPISKL